MLNSVRQNDSEHTVRDDVTFKVLEGTLRPRPHVTGNV